MPRSSFGEENINDYTIVESKPSAFAGATTGARGDKDTASGAFTLFTVTGDVLVRIYGVSTLTPVGTSGTLEVGVAGNTAYLIALTTATNISTNKLWSDSSPALGDLFSTVLGPYTIPNGLDIIETTKTTDLSAGNIRYVCLYRPLTSDGKVVAA